MKKTVKKAQFGLLAKAAGRAIEKSSANSAKRTAENIAKATVTKNAENAGWAASRQVERFNRGMIDSKPVKSVYNSADKYAKDQASKKSSSELVKRDFPTAPKQKTPERYSTSDRDKFLESKKTPNDLKREELIKSKVFSDQSVRGVNRNRKAKGPVKLNELDNVKKSKMKSGGMLKRADGSYSKRGLWDNIRANKGSGKKPTAAMLKQEKKIKAKTKK